MTENYNKKLSSENINELFKEAYRGNKEAEKELFLNLTVRFKVITRLRVSNSEDAKDIIQDVLTVVSRKYKGLTEDVNFVAWAHQVLKFQIMKYYKKVSTDNRRSKNLADEVISSTGWEPNPMLRDKLIHCLRKINKKNSLYARILNMHFQGYVTEEICQKLKIKSNYCYVILLRARSMIELCLEKGEV